MWESDEQKRAYEKTAEALARLLARRLARRHHQEDMDRAAARQRPPVAPQEDQAAGAGQAEGERPVRPSALD